MCVAWPKAVSAASISVSLSVGCAWIVSATSRATAAVSTASVPSAISSPAPAPTIPTPNTRSVFGSNEDLRQALGARDRLSPARGGPGKAGDLDFAVRVLRLGLGQSAPGDFGIGEDDGGNRQVVERGRLTRQRLDGHVRLARRLVGEHRFAGDVSDGQNVGIGRASLWIDFDEALLVDFAPVVFSSPRSRLFGRRPTETSTRSKVCFGIDPFALQLGNDPLFRRGQLHDLGIQLGSPQRACRAAF